jgi:DNA-binding NarL/FixJ family response regulator
LNKQRLRILIADDHPIFRRGLCDVLETDDRLELVGEAADGEEALRLVQELDPDIIILDVFMPKMTGLQAARSLLSTKSETKAILLTMLEDEDILHEALDIGIHGYVLKENAAEDLVHAIHRTQEGGTFLSASLSDLLIKRRSRATRLLADQPGLKDLTPMEARILRLIAEDKTTKEIASELGRAVRTIETHRQNISQKLGLSGSHSLLKFAFDHKSEL